MRITQYTQFRHCSCISLNQTVYRRGSLFFLRRCPALSRWWCPALRVSPIHLSPSMAGGVRLSGCLASLVSLHLSPSLPHDVRNFGCLPIHLSPCLPTHSPFICLPVWLVSSLVSRFTCLPSFAGGVRLRNVSLPIELI